MSPEATSTGIDPGLLGRFRAAGSQIGWRPAEGSSRARGTPDGARIAHLNDEEARIETRSIRGTRVLTVDSGPLGALVLLLEWADRGTPSRLLTHEAGEVPGFATGALEARWGRSKAPPALAVPLSDVVTLARYALA